MHISSSKLDWFMSNWDWNAQRPILHILSNTFHHRKCFIFVIICNYPWSPHVTAAVHVQGLEGRSMAPHQRRLIYSLYGVVEHSGTLRNGHYTAYVKLRSSQTTIAERLRFLQSESPNQMSVSQLVAKLHAISLSSQQQQPRPGCDDDTMSATDGRWFHISDTSVSQVKLTNVLLCQAYLLFYERIA